MRVSRIDRTWCSVTLWTGMSRITVCKQSWTAPFEQDRSGNVKVDRITTRAIRSVPRGRGNLIKVREYCKKKIADYQLKYHDLRVTIIVISKKEKYISLTIFVLTISTGYLFTKLNHPLAKTYNLSSIQLVCIQNAEK